MEKLLRVLLCVSLLICGRGWEKSKEVLGVAFVVLLFLQVGVVVGIVGVVERGGGGGLAKARGGEGARRTSRRSGPARHRSYERLDGEVSVAGTSRRTWRTSGATWRGGEIGGGGSRGRGRKDLVRWEGLGVDC